MALFTGAVDEGRSGAANLVLNGMAGPSGGEKGTVLADEVEVWFSGQRPTETTIVGAVSGWEQDAWVLSHGFVLWLGQAVPPQFAC